MPIITAVSSPTTALITSTSDASGNISYVTANTTAMVIDTNQNTTYIGYVSAPNTFGYKNRVINGAFAIDQRANGTAQLGVAGGSTYFLADRFRVGGSALSTGRFTWQQVTDAPNGFTNSGKITVTTAQSTTSEVQVLTHWMEGLNVSDFAWGTSSATSAALSFWVKASVTGTYSVAIRSDNVGTNYSYVATYSVTAANTWQYITIIIPPITVGTWTMSVDYGIRIDWDIGSGTSGNQTTGNVWTAGNYFKAPGTVNLVSNNGATWQITGVQFEKGSIATPFEFRDYGRELQLCQRYCFKPLDGSLNGNAAYWSGATAAAYNSGSVSCYGSAFLPVAMRRSPSVTATVGIYCNSINGNSNTAYQHSFTVYPTSGYATNLNGIYLIVTTGAAGSSGVANEFCWLNATAGGYLIFTSEY